MKIRAETVLVTALILASLNTAYLSWRFLALHAGLVTPGSGLCSITAFIDCDQVLMTPQARAFYVPNALLGFGFFLGCSLWWRLGTRLGPEYRRRITRTLAFWLGVSCVATFWFFWLLVRLPNLCPLCPWNHLLNYVAFGAACTVDANNAGAGETSGAAAAGTAGRVVCGTVYSDSARVDTRLVSGLRGLTIQ